jgi:hypothetical protein
MIDSVGYRLLNSLILNECLSIYESGLSHTRQMIGMVCEKSITTILRILKGECRCHERTVEAWFGIPTGDRKGTEDNMRNIGPLQIPMRKRHPAPQKSGCTFSITKAAKDRQVQRDCSLPSRCSMSLWMSHNRALNV